MRGPSLTYASDTYKESTSTSSLMFWALAMAEWRTFSTAGAMRLLVLRSVVIAAPAFFPRIRSTTSRAFCGEIRMYLASALATISLRLCRFLGGCLCLMTFECASRRKLTQFVSHHIFGHVNRNELSSVMHRDRVTH